MYYIAHTRNTVDGYYKTWLIGGSEPILLIKHLDKRAQQKYVFDTIEVLNIPAVELVE